MRFICEVFNAIIQDFKCYSTTPKILDDAADIFRILSMIQMNLTVPNRENNTKCSAEPFQI